VIVVRKVVRSLTAAMPGWLLVVFSVCLAIPLARLVVLLLTAAFVPGATRESASCVERVEGRQVAPALR
jgi:hypothetical protein